MATIDLVLCFLERALPLLHALLVLPVVEGASIRRHAVFEVFALQPLQLGPSARGEKMVDEMHCGLVGEHAFQQVARQCLSATLHSKK